MARWPGHCRRCRAGRWLAGLLAAQGTSQTRSCTKWIRHKANCKAHTGLDDNAGGHPEVHWLPEWEGSACAGDSIVTAGLQGNEGHLLVLAVTSGFRSRSSSWKGSIPRCPCLETALLCPPGLEAAASNSTVTALAAQVAPQRPADMQLHSPIEEQVGLVEDVEVLGSLQQESLEKYITRRAAN